MKKRLFAALLTTLLVVLAAFPAFAEAEETPAENTYLVLTGKGTGNITVVFEDGELAAGQTYTVSADIMFDGVILNGGNAYLNYYPYDAGGNLLSGWIDWANTTSNGTVTDWFHASYTFTVGSDVAKAHFGMGFYLSEGIMKVDNFSIVDAQGNVVFSDDFEDEDVSDWLEKEPFQSVSFEKGEIVIESEESKPEESVAEESKSEESKPAVSKPESSRPVTESSAAGSTDTSSPADEQDNTGTIIAVVVAAVVVVAVVVIIVVTKKKKQA